MSRKNGLIVAAAGLVAVIAFILASRINYRIGFPLDDAWIHQTYARSLALQGEFSLIPGEPSAGSTSPLWTIFLIPGQWLGGSGVFFYTFLLGFLCLVVVSLVGEGLFHEMAAPFSRSLEKPRHLLPVAGLVLATEWHLVWAACSGMETAMYAAVILLILLLAWRAKTPAFWLGGLIGVAIWIRPDAITLLGPVAMILFFQASNWKNRILQTGYLFFGMLIPLAGYLLFNYSLSGSLWPSTFYAKQAEYASLWSTSILIRFIRLARLPLVGVGLLLLPGFVYQAWVIIRQRKWNHAAILLWWLGYTAIFAYRLPVEYQHGRYLIPAMPVYLLLGLCGTIEAYSKLKWTNRSKRLFRFAGKTALFLMVVAFLATGARAFAVDVAIIESEMVNTAQWLRENTSPGDLLAVHDIGAIGYYSERRIIDLAGLVTPDVIPFMRDEQKLSEYLDQQGVAYLVTFPDWYDSLPVGLEIAFQTQGAFSIAQGGTNMTVYRWKSGN